MDWDEMRGALSRAYDRLDMLPDQYRRWELDIDFEQGEITIHYPQYGYTLPEPIQHAKVLNLVADMLNGIGYTMVYDPIDGHYRLRRIK